jgi:glucose-1-phosphate adenylyltransferase
MSTKRTEIISFVEKPADPPGIPGQAGLRARLDGHLRLSDEIPDGPASPRRRRPEGLQSRFRQGHHPLHRQARQGRGPSLRHFLRAFDFEREAYWRDVGTIDAYWEANIDLTDITPELDIYDRDWPIWTYAEIKPPAKFVHDEEGRRGIGRVVARLRRLHHLGRMRCGAA